MSNEDKLIRDSGRGIRARQLAENELLAEAFKGLEDAYTKAWRGTMIEDVSAREKLFLAINVVGKVREHLARIIVDGNLAQAELESLAQLAEQRKKRSGVR